MNKKDVKLIRELADKLPTVYDQTISGFYEDYDENGELKLFPNIVTHPINHERRMRRAYERIGMEGIKSYLDSIYTLVKNRNENFQIREGVTDKEEVLRVQDDSNQS